MDKSHILVPVKLPNIAAACPTFGVPVRGQGYSTGVLGLHDYTVTDAAIALMLALPADRSVWVGYGNGVGGFAWHEDTAPVLNLELYTDVGEKRFFDVYHSATTDRWYVLPYVRTDYFADAAGDHYSDHSAGAFEVTAGEVAALIAALERQ